MKTITIEHEVTGWLIRHIDILPGKYSVILVDDYNNTLDKKHFKTFDEAVEYVRSNLL